MTTIVVRANAGEFAVNGVSAQSLHARIWAWIVSRHHIAADRRYLQSLPDEMLRYIGIGRSEIGTVTEHGRGVLRR